MNNATTPYLTKKRYWFVNSACLLAALGLTAVVDEGWAVTISVRSSGEALYIDKTEPGRTLKEACSVAESRVNVRNVTQLFFGRNDSFLYQDLIREDLSFFQSIKFKKISFAPYIPATATLYVVDFLGQLDLSNVETLAMSFETYNPEDFSAIWPRLGSLENLHFQVRFLAVPSNAWDFLPGSVGERVKTKEIADAQRTIKTGKATTEVFYTDKHVEQMKASWTSLLASADTETDGGSGQSTTGAGSDAVTGDPFDHGF